MTRISITHTVAKLLWRYAGGPSGYRQSAPRPRLAPCPVQSTDKAHAFACLTALNLAPLLILFPLAWEPRPLDAGGAAAAVRAGRDLGLLSGSRHPSGTGARSRWRSSSGLFGSRWWPPMAKTVAAGAGAPVEGALSAFCPRGPESSASSPWPTFFLDRRLTITLAKGSCAVGQVGKRRGGLWAASPGGVLASG